MATVRRGAPAQPAADVARAGDCAGAVSSCPFWVQDAAAAPAGRPDVRTLLAFYGVPALAAPCAAALAARSGAGTPLQLGAALAAVVVAWGWCGWRARRAAVSGAADAPHPPTGPGQGSAR
jgi:hypothetical protein